jgi:hypothetical protein
MPWYVKGKSKVIGPLTPSELKSLAETGRLTAGHLVSTNAEGPWATADKVKGLVFGKANATTSPVTAKVSPPAPARHDAFREPKSQSHSLPPPLPFPLGSHLDPQAEADCKETATEDPPGLQSQINGCSSATQSKATSPLEKIKALLLRACNQILRPGSLRIGVIVVLLLCALLTVFKWQYNADRVTRREIHRQRLEDHLADCLDYIEQAANQPSDSKDLTKKAVFALHDASSEAHKLADFDLFNPALYWANFLEVVIVQHQSHESEGPIAAYYSGPQVTAGRRSLVLERHVLAYWKTRSAGSYRIAKFLECAEGFARKNVVYFKRISALAIRICELRLKAGNSPEEIQEFLEAGPSYAFHDIKAPSKLALAIVRSDRRLEERFFWEIEELRTQQERTVDGKREAERPATRKEKFMIINDWLESEFRQFMTKLFQE